MQRSFRMENAQDQLDREIRIERHSRLFVNADGGVAFDREQRAELFVRQLGNGFGKIVHRLALLTCQRKDRMAPQLGQTASEFGLKDHNKSNSEEHRKTAEEPADRSFLKSQSIFREKICAKRPPPVVYHAHGVAPDF